MASTFAGLSITGRGLAASQAGLATTTNNISNENTAGYSRQVLNQISIGPAAVYSSTSLVGSGPDVASVDRVWSFRLNQKYWQASASLGEWQTKTNTLTEAEGIISSDTDTGFSATLDDFYDALETMQTDNDSSAATALVSAGEAVCDQLNEMSSSLTQLRSDLNNDVKSTVDEINSYARQIADLNQRIGVAQASGVSANELCDQRDLLVDKLSALTDVQVSQTTVGTAADGTTLTTYTINAGGGTLVSGDRYNQLQCYTVTNQSSDQYGMYGIRWEETGNAFRAGDSGSLGATLALRDGTGTDGAAKGIPYYRSKLDQFAQTFAQVFNEGVTTSDGASYNGHADGVALGDGTTTGIRFFSYDGLSSAALMTSGSDTDAVYANITAANISISADIAIAPTLVATASANGESGNTDNLADLITLCGSSSSMFDGTSPNDFYASVVATLGTAASYASRQSDNKDAMVSYVSTSRSSVSGVSSNEETSNMVKYQAAYQAASAMVNTWNEVYQETINMVSDD